MVLCGGLVVHCIGDAYAYPLAVHWWCTGGALVVPGLVVHGDAVVMVQWALVVVQWWFGRAVSLELN